jgi:hypothetical protein
VNTIINKLVTALYVLLKKQFFDSRRERTFGCYTVPLSALVEQKVQEVEIAVEKVNEEFSTRMGLLVPQVRHKIFFEGGAKPGIYWKKNTWNEWRRMSNSKRTHKTSYLTSKPNSYSEEQKNLLVEFEFIVVELRVRLAKLVALRNAISEFE